MSDTNKTTHEELVEVRRHFYKHHTPKELIDFFLGLRGPVDEAGKEAIAKLLFGEDATIESATEMMKTRRQ